MRDSNTAHVTLETLSDGTHRILARVPLSDARSMLFVQASRFRLSLVSCEIDTTGRPSRILGVTTLFERQFEDFDRAWVIARKEIGT